MFENYEKDYSKMGFKDIVGIDEVGRGTLFGDVVACAIIMPMDLRIEGIKDSKKLTEKKREKLYEIILEEALAVGVGRVDSDTIDKINIRMATHLAMSKAISNLRDRNGDEVTPDILLIDAEKIESEFTQVSIVKGDDKCYSIACASIVAKVYRDRLCKLWAKEYPGYGLERHKGYATKLHREAIKLYGPSDMHRKSFLKNIGDW
ncbi:ribonuclease HII [Anaerosphaera multitolerans]|uniref:Ribonuclease HII n=2 Tax=Anaerosphaera multitolerans TaxID=2487351 RepID=A0A437S837_9FIRM|nr:ribonuclease HII [Anaerosphaera multitolerans]RVU55245.1 ribonuclease HII [Anaerosphaera multitolerans]